MTTKTHASLTGSDLHEPKGISGATSGQVYVANGASSGAWTTLSTPVFMSKHIAGLTWQNDAGDTTNDIQIITGTCRDSTNTADMTLAATLTKQLDVAWAVGTHQGGLDTGVVANTTYHIWLIKRSDTGVVDALFSTSATAPTMPTNYDKKRRIGSFRRAGGVNQQVTVTETEGGSIKVEIVPLRDNTTGSINTSVVTYTFQSLPIGVAYEADISLQPNTISTSQVNLTVTPGDITPTVSSTVFNIQTICDATPAALGLTTQVSKIRTNSSGQIKFIASNSLNTNLHVMLNGWKDYRRD